MKALVNDLLFASSAFGQVSLAFGLTLTLTSSVLDAQPVVARVGDDARWRCSLILTVMSSSEIVW